MIHSETDVLIIGTGGAGLYAAIRAAEAGMRVTIWEKGLVGRSGGTVSGAGISAVGPWSDPEDSPEVYFQDTVKGGSFLSDQPLARILAEEARDRIMEMECWGLCFDREADGSYVLDRAGGHSFPRVMAISDRVGLQMTKVLRTRLLCFEAEHYPDVVTTRLLTRNGQIIGAMGLDLRAGEIHLIKAPSVVLATGGIGQLYPVTSNPVQVTGDGLSLALEAGAALVNMEQVQFYPCGLVHPPSLRGFILGIQEYAKLYNVKNERFMGRYEPDSFEHTTRDRLARGIFAEISAGRGTEHGGVYLDATDLPETTFRSFMHEIEICAERGFDYRKQRVEIAPAAHFFMGGVGIDAQAGTSLVGLFAAGEVSGGVQGGNRLSGNSLSEIVVFGSRAGVSAAKHAEGSGRYEPDKEQVAAEESRLQILLKRKTSELSPTWGKKRLRHIMREHAGVVRKAEGLTAAREQLQELEEDLLPRINIQGSHFHFNQSLQAYLELEKMVKAARAVVGAGLARKESRGAHFREDFPEWDTTVPPRCTVVRLENDKLVVGLRPAQLTEMEP
ncbi:MAG: FAD-binding protein [Desulfohalobiaceae bacterium]|nr:FAD-binding protein [Desulfohalobiaceae bacterium]